MLLGQSVAHIWKQVALNSFFHVLVFTVSGIILFSSDMRMSEDSSLGSNSVMIFTYDKICIASVCRPLLTLP